MSRQRPAANMGLELPVPRDAEADLNGRPSEELTALPISETEERPGRRARSGGGFFKLLFVAALLVGGAWIGGKYWPEIKARLDGEGDQAGAGASPSTGATEAKPASEKQKPAPEPAAVAPPEPAARAGGQGTAAAVEAKQEAKQDGKVDDKDEGKSEKAAPARRSRQATVKEKDHIRPPTIDLKSMMAPDPSQLPPTPPPEPVRPPPPSEPPAQENP